MTINYNALADGFRLGSSKSDEVVQLHPGAPIVFDSVLRYHSRMREKRKCEWCQQDFVPRKKTSKYCGNDCYLSHKSQLSTCQIECQSCKKIFEAKRGERRKFCSSSCAASTNNVLVPKRKPERICEASECDNGVRSGRTFCGEHKSEYKAIRREQQVQRWLNGEWAGGTNYGLSTIIRAYLLEQSDYKCSKCGFNTPHPDDNKTILEINHINGDGTDHSPENLEVICPNCHALTSSYRARNMGNGRPQYYIRRSK